MSCIQSYYSDYLNSQEGFNIFHTEVINMPRDEFENTGLQKIKTLAGYLLLTETKLQKEGNNYKDILQLIANELRKNNYPEIRDTNLEERYFTFKDINSHYESEGRMFRHLMSLCDFFGFFTSTSKEKKIINYDKCREYYLADDEILIPVARNNLVMFNIHENNFIKSLVGISIDTRSDYRPTYSILKYIDYIKRPVTDFELSVLFGRVDKLKQEHNIFERAINIGSVLPNTVQAQKTFFFDEMGWKHGNGKYFTYARSQEPYFKFHTYLLLMEKFGLLVHDSITETYILSDYSKDMLKDSVSSLVVDLEKLLEIVDNYGSHNKELNDIILYQRNPELLNIIKNDDTFIEKMNFRSLNKPIRDKTGKRVRNRLISELAKIQADYKCQYKNMHIFKTPDGKYYCETHHVLQFNAEDGPDITNNLVVLGPEAHMIIHHACLDDVNNVYMQLIKNNVLTYERFAEMITKYKCLNKNHIKLLFEKKIITKIENDNLLRLYNDQIQAS